jgi:hypothetical protein
LSVESLTSTARFRRSFKCCSVRTAFIDADHVDVAPGRLTASRGCPP